MLVIDPVLDYDEKSGSIATTSADEILAYIERESLEPILDPRYASSCRSFVGCRLPEATGPARRRRSASKVVDVQELWKAIYDLPPTFRTRRVAMGQIVRGRRSLSQIGGMDVRVLFSPGHTLASMTYLVGECGLHPRHSVDAGFRHGALRFPGRRCAQLWRTIQRILALAGRNPPVRRPRLHARRPRARLGKHRRGAEALATFIFSRRTDEEAFVALRRAATPSFRCRS